MFKIMKITWNIIEKLMMIAIILISAIIIIQKVTNNEKSLLGFRLFRVQTGSMEPKYKVGDVILVKEKDTNKLKIGDDITYWGSTGVMKGRLITHRIIDIEEIKNEKIFHTKGIANLAEDPIVHANQINGIVLGKLYIITFICNIFNNIYALYFLGILPLTIYVCLGYYKDKKRKYESE